MAVAIIKLSTTISVYWASHNDDRKILSAMKIFRWLKFRPQKVLAAADEFMEFYGDQAYAEARKEMRAARGRGDRRQEKFYTRVSLEIAKRTDIEIGLDTTTRYLEEQEPYDPGPGFVRNRNETFH